jgi:WD40 repeat protein
MKLLVVSSVGDLYVGLGCMVRRYGGGGVLDYTATQGDGKGILDILILSSCERFLYGAFTSKIVICWDVATAGVQGVIRVNKRLTSMIYRSMETLVPGKGVLLASDKSGDVWAIEAPLLANKVLVAGHTASVVTDLTYFNIDNKGYIATSDRDEKIRVSFFPQLAQIQTYCLGHTNVVTSVLYIEKFKLLITCGWDHSVYLWEPLTGKIIYQLYTKYRSTTTEAVESAENDDENNDENNDENDATDKAYDHKKAGNYPIKLVVYDDIVAIIFSGISLVQLYTVVFDGNVHSIVENSSITLPSPPADIYFSNAGDLCVLLPPPDHISMYRISIPQSLQYSMVIINQLQADCNEKNICFNQEMILMAEEGHNSGLEKEKLKDNYMGKWKERREENDKKRKKVEKPIENKEIIG